MKIQAKLIPRESRYADLTASVARQASREVVTAEHGKTKSHYRLLIRLKGRTLTNSFSSSFIPARRSLAFFS